MKVELITGTETVILTKAILLYQQAKSYGSERMVYASLHEVQDAGTKARPDFQIMPGSALTQESLLQVMGSIAERFVTNVEILPENVISYSPQHLVWWVPAACRTVFINNRELGKRSASVPHPPLLFVVANGAWYIYALPEDRRPTAETELCHAPYFNVYDNGSICTGSAKTPGKMTMESIAQWEAAFFQSEFTHVNGGTKKSKHPRGEYALWKELLDGNYKDYPMEYLAPTSKKVSQVMQVVANQVGGRNG